MNSAGDVGWRPSDLGVDVTGGFVGPGGPHIFRLFDLDEPEKLHIGSKCQQATEQEIEAMKYIKQCFKDFYDCTQKLIAKLLAAITWCGPVRSSWCRGCRS